MLPVALKPFYKLVGQPNPRFLRKGVSYDLTTLTKAQADELHAGGWKHIKKLKEKAAKQFPTDFEQ